MIILPYEEQPAAFHPWSSDFPAAAAILRDAIQQRVPELHVEHIGSTSIPGCCGKGVLDLAVLYQAGELESATEGLNALGFQPQGGPEPFPESRPMRVGCIVHHGRHLRIHAHVIESGSREHHELLWFRDTLRANEALRLDYEAKKRAVLAEGITNSIAYCHAKGSFITNLLSDCPR